MVFPSLRLTKVAMTGVIRLPTKGVDPLIVKIVIMVEDLCNIFLIGIPGSDISTIGVILAKLTSRIFVDTDVPIQTKQAGPCKPLLICTGTWPMRTPLWFHAVQITCSTFGFLFPIEISGIL